MKISEYSLNLGYSTLTAYLQDVIGVANTDRAVQDFRLGYTWNVKSGFGGGTIFWRIDYTGICGGDLALFDESGIELKREDVIRHLEKRIEPYDTKPCLFGQHLISSKPLAIVENELTVLLAAFKYQSITWLATGSQDLTDTMLSGLFPRPITLFPSDMSQEYWHGLADNFSNCTVSDNFTDKNINQYILSHE